MSWGGLIVSFRRKWSFEHLASDSQYEAGPKTCANITWYRSVFLSSYYSFKI